MAQMGPGPLFPARGRLRQDDNRRVKPMYRPEEPEAGPLEVPTQGLNWTMARRNLS